MIVPNDVHPDPEIAERCDTVGAKLFSLDADAYAKLADAKTPQPALAVVEAPSLAIDDRFASPGSALFLVLVDVSDPGNVGTLIRTAEASGCRGVVVTAETADVLSPKVVRSSAGSVLRVPIGEATHDEIPAALETLNAHVVATMMDGEPYDEARFESGQRVALLLGSEAHGVGADVLEYADRSLSIPMDGKVESLNVATTGSVLAFTIRSAIR